MPISVARTRDLSTLRLGQIRTLLAGAFGEYSDDDWLHSLYW